MSLDAGRAGVRADQVDVHGRVTSPSFLNELLEDLPEWTDMPVWVNGTEKLLPSNNSVPVTSPILADIAYPDIRRDNQYFTYRESPTPVDGLAKIKSIKGNTLVWNQLANIGNFSSTLGSLSQSGDIITYTITSLGEYNYSNRANKALLVNTKANHKYFLSCDIYAPHDNIMYLFLIKSSVEGMNRSVSGNIVANQWSRINGFIQDPSAIYATMQVAFNTTPSSDFSVDEQIQFKNMMLIDLTMMFGVGNEPATVEEFISLFPLPYYDYNAGVLLSFNGTGINTANEDESEEHTTTLPISTYFPTGMKSAGTVYDELTPTKAVTRVGAVDLGSLTWVYESSIPRFYTTDINALIKKPVDNYAKANAISSIYENTTFNQLYATEKKNMTMAIGETGTFSIINTSYTDANAFKTAMSGVYLYYELATPVELPTLSLSLGD